MGVLQIGSLFSGIGGLELGLVRAGLGPIVWGCEIDNYRRELWQQRFAAPCFLDASLFMPTRGSADLVCGGFPCQDISQAGRKAGLDGARSGLWKELIRIVGLVRPSWVVVENNHHMWRSWVPVLRGALGRLGYASVPLRLSAAEVGAWHRRARCFVVAHADGERLWRLSWWGGWQGGTASEAEPGHARAERAPADAHAEGQLQPRRGVAAQRGRLSVTSWWDAEPDVVRVVHGVPGGLDRSRREALGDAVVPQVAEMIGRAIMEVCA